MRALETVLARFSVSLLWKFENGEIMFFLSVQFGSQQIEFRRSGLERSKPGETSIPENGILDSNTN